MKAQRAISVVTAVLVFFLAASAFVLSYDALHRLALDNGITPKLAWLWPLTLDAVMIAASLSVLRNSLNGEGAWYPWILVGIFTVLSVTFNVIHARNDTLPAWGSDLLARAVFALPPAVTFLAFELLTGQIKSAIKRAGATSTLATLAEAVEMARAEVSQLNQEADELEQRCDTLRAELAGLESAKQANVTLKSDASESDSGFTPGDTGALASANNTRQAKKQARQCQIIEAIAEDPSVTYDELAQVTRASLRTVKRDVKELIEAGKVSRNGHKLEVMTPDMPEYQSITEPVTTN